MSYTDKLSQININYKRAEEKFLECRKNYLEECINVVNTYYCNIEQFTDSKSFNKKYEKEFIDNLKKASNILKRLGIIENRIDYCNNIIQKKINI